jgi:hypothetical protein
MGGDQAIAASRASICCFGTAPMTWSRALPSLSTGLAPEARD